MIYDFIKENGPVTIAEIADNAGINPTDALSEVQHLRSTDNAIYFTGMKHCSISGKLSMQYDIKPVQATQLGGI